MGVIYALYVFSILFSTGYSQYNLINDIRNLDVGKLIIDTDAGSDDAVGLFLAVNKLLLGNGPQIVAITCVGGNAKASQVAINVLKTLRIARYEHKIPIYIGSHSAILHDPKSDGYWGLDGFGDVPFPNPPSIKEVQNEHGVMALIRLAKENPGELTLVALGPLTNVALAIRLDPQFRYNLKHLIWMGDSYQGLGNVQPGVEYNARVDPEANYMVFNSEGPPIIVVPWEIDQLWTPVPLAWRLNVLGKAGGSVINFMNAIERKALKQTLWSSVDSKTIAFVLDPTMVTSVAKHRVVPLVQGPEARGVFLIDYLNRDNLTENAIYITGMSTIRYKQMLMTFLPAHN